MLLMGPRRFLLWVFIITCNLKSYYCKTMLDIVSFNSRGRDKVPETSLHVYSEQDEKKTPRGPHKSEGTQEQASLRMAKKDLFKDRWANPEPHPWCRQSSPDGWSRRYDLWIKGWADVDECTVVSFDHCIWICFLWKCLIPFQRVLSEVIAWASLQ